jgi:DNA-binding transcriptional ArsR family regulator
MLRLAHQERTASELAAAAGLSPSAASPHLKLLRQVGLLHMRVDAKRRLYQVDFTRLGKVRAALDELWENRLEALKSQAEQSPTGQKRRDRSSA